MRNLCVCENLIYGELGLHYGVVGGSEHCLNAVGNKCLCGEGDFVNGRARALDHFNALGLEIRLRVGYRLSRRILTDIVEQADLLYIRVLEKNKVHYSVGVEIIGGSGNLTAGCVEGINELCAEGIADCGKHDRDIAVLGLDCRLHSDCDRGRDADHKIDLVNDEVRDYLVHNNRVAVAVVVFDFDLDALFGGDGSELLFDVIDYLIERCVIDIVADADGVFLFSVSARFAAGGEAGNCEHKCEYKCDYLFHCISSFR